jgi:molybdopterin-synthase adenylyltransferase
MKHRLKNEIIERFSRQIVLKDVGIIGQKKILSAKILIVGLGGLGCPAAEYLSRAGVGTIGLIDDDKVSLSNIHRQSLYDSDDINKLKVRTVKKKINFINPNTRVQTYNLRLNTLNYKNIVNNYDYIIDGSDNFKTKLLVNDLSFKYNKFLVCGAISKFDGHIFTFNFKDKKSPCLRCFFQESEVFDDLLNCEAEGIMGTVAGIVGTMQANEILKKILNIGQTKDCYIFILDLINLNFRKVKIKKRKKCLCN